MRQEMITYDLFCQTAQKMQSHGEKISVRTVLSHTGGSFSKIAGFLKQWRQTQVHAQSVVDRELSTHLKQAILAEVGKAVTETKILLETQLSQTSDQLDEAHEALAKQEKELEEAAQEIKQLNQALFVKERLEAQHAEKIQALGDKLEKFVHAVHEADKRAAIANESLAKQEKILQALEEKLAQSIQAQHEADKRAAIAEARCTDVEKQRKKSEK
jgi:chromosome segregation ATPase